ncbi:beta-ketoacyl synthase N-terminal-like domain-containing protein [Nocardia sp. CDC153]|uniref:beta-ketoacyl synthase N-terminal-like domain-containing protein n=1 Tax=Nocardia sp. CDC153 TaxID=3112167 RepID=UPI002DBEE8BA|nr:beta-ketoacyl synthase N-terminal-like domain-containing protein [Nocardia sp. CDC153]MEC3952035.1 beta-ketoacyl synthase N-terminal-like domain-containing protein [Nocardia sp. CDC153]
MSTSIESAWQTRELLLDAMRRLRTTADHENSDRSRTSAVLGMGVRLPDGVDSPAALWARLTSDRDALWSSRARVSGWPGGGPDAMEPNLPRRLVYDVAREALADAGLSAARLENVSVGVYLGVSQGGLAAALSRRLHLCGPSLAVDPRGSSALVALHLAVRGLRSGDCDFALVGGAGGDDCVMLLLGSGGDYGSNSRPPRAHVLGTAVGGDHRALTRTGRHELLRRALSDARLRAEQVSYVELLGNAIVAGGPPGLEAVRAVYGSGSTRCVLGGADLDPSGTELAAGMLAVARTILIIEHRRSPSHAGAALRNGDIDLGGTRLVAPAASVALEVCGPIQPFAAAVGAFVSDGTDTHVLLGGAPGPSSTESTRR